MPFSLAQKFVSLGMASPLAVEYANQLQSGIYNWQRLMRLGMIPDLAKYLAIGLSSGTLDGRKAREMGMSEAQLALSTSNATLAPLMAVGNRGYMPDNTLLVDAANKTVSETRLLVTLGRKPLSMIKCSFSGFNLTPATAAEPNVGNDQLIEVAWELFDGSQVRRETFGGQNVGTILNGANDYQSDGLLASAFGLTQFAPGTKLWYRERRTPVGAVNVAKHGRVGSSSMTGERTVYGDGTAPSQLLNSGALNAVAGGITIGADHAPTIILGRTIGDPDISIVSIGDSIPTGVGDLYGGGDGSISGGPVQRASFTAGVIPFSKMSVGTAQAAHFAATNARRVANMKYFTHAIFWHGTNDGAVGGATAAATLTAIQTGWGAVRNAAGSKIRHVAQLDILPRYTGGGGGSPTTGFATGGAFRDPLNTSLAAAVGSNGLNQFISASSVLADPGTPDRWAAGMQSDGVHPNATGAATGGNLIATAMGAWV